ncbi:MAG: uroporphyrinogen decarboxylase family protein [Ignavibacteriaceae bacterium]
MKKKSLLKSVEEAYKEGRRLVVPLMGFPGLQITGCNIKIAQQNYTEHFKVIKTLCSTFKPDAVFPLMDLCVEANALGKYTIFPKNESATVLNDTFNEDDLILADSVNITSDTRMQGYSETMKLMTKELPGNILRGAYVTGPYTLSALMMGAEEAAVSTLLNPSELHKLCRISAEKIKEYICLMVESGAQLICILEPSAVMLGPDQFKEFSADYVSSIVKDYINTDVASIFHICGNSMHLINIMSSVGVDALSLDSPDTGVDLPGAAGMVPPNILIIGNLSPTGTLLFGSPDKVELKTTELLRQMDKYSNFILSTGCDIPQETPIENIQAFMRAGKNYRINNE